jgi:hypothetical protein
MDLVEARARGFELVARHPWERARLALVGRLIAEHVRLRPGDVVLDVGCGDTYVVDELAHAHPDVQFYAVDSAFTDDLIATYRARLTTRNVSLFASLDEVPPARPARLVLLMDVIEHVPDDAAFLRDVCGRPLVDRQTSVLITVPSYQVLFCSHDRFLGHYRRYSTRTLRDLLAEVDLVSTRSGHLFASLVPVRVLQVVRERLFRPADAPTRVAMWNGGESATRAFTALLTIDGRLGLWLTEFGVAAPGLSNFAICRKSA